MKKLYEAIDGKLFDNEADCLEYEENKIIYLCSDGRRTTYKNAVFAYIPDTGTLEMFKKMVANNHDRMESSFITLTGLYYAKPHLFGKKRTWEFTVSDMVIKVINSL